MKTERIRIILQIIAVFAILFVLWGMIFIVPKIGTSHLQKLKATNAQLTATLDSLKMAYEAERKSRFITPEQRRYGESLIVQPEARFILKRATFDSLYSNTELRLWYGGESETKDGKVVLYFYITRKGKEVRDEDK